MITALVSGIFGLANAFLPDLFGFFKRKQEAEERQRDRQHELDMLDKQAEVAERTASLKLEEVKVGGIVLGGVLGEFIQAVWGYLFGYRGGLKVKELASRL